MWDVDKIFRYELRRLLRNKVFFGMLALLLVFCWTLLTGEILLGAGNTAPFSPWSFGLYLARLLPLLCVGQLFFLSRYVSRREGQVARLTAATPVDRRRYAMVRAGGVLTAGGLLVLAALALAGGLFWRFFQQPPTGDLVLAALVVLLPGELFSLGLGWRLGRIHPALLYGAMALVVLLCLAPLPGNGSLSLAAFFSGYPETLPLLDPPLTLPPSLWVSRLVYLLAGLLLLGWGPRGKR